MHLSGAELAALASVLAAAPAVVLLLLSARHHTGLSRRAHRLLALGSASAAVTALVGLGVHLTRHAPAVHDAADRKQLGTFIAVAMALSTATLLWGTLALPRAAGSAAVATRHLLDALVIAASLWFVGWVLLSKPPRVLAGLTPNNCVPVLLPAAVAAMAFGVTVILGLRVPRPRGATVCVGAGVTMVALAGAGLAAGICQDWPVVVMASAVALPVGLLGTAGAVRVADRAVAVENDIARRGTAYAFWPMLAMAGSATYHLVRGGDFDSVGIAVGSIEGFALVARQYLALADVRGYAERLRQREAHFRELAHTDPLTGLANRRGLLRALHSAAFAGPPCVLLGLDLDGFKNVNDMRGHDTGDAVLIEVGERLRANLRPGDVAARLGGDEFAVLMWARPEESHRAAERLLGVLSRPYEHANGTVFLSASIGVAGTDTAGDVAALMHNADSALRYAKQRGKNRVERYDVEYDGRLRRRTTIEHELRGAIERDELHLVYQPVVALPSTRPVGAEALLRWHHPELGAVGPGEFIPVAEDCGMIDRLGEWVLHQACRQLSLWLTAGYDVWISVNVSPRELHAPEYVVRVTEVLRAHRVAPQRLVLEVTEHAVATDLEELIQRLRTLRGTGVRIALDDFGAGYSSLGQLRHLPADILKIVHSLVAEPESRTGRTAPLVDVVVRLGHRLGLEVIAEGMEAPAQLKVVDEAGCRFGQGSLFGWGVPAEHLEARLAAAASAADAHSPAEPATHAVPTEPATHAVPVEPPAMRPTPVEPPARRPVPRPAHNEISSLRPASGGAAAARPGSGEPAAARPASDLNAAARPLSDLNGAARPLSDLNGAARPASDVNAAARPVSDVNGATRPASDVNGATRSALDVNGAARPAPDVSAAAFPASVAAREQADGSAEPPATTPPVQDVRSVDSSREMRQA